MYVDELLPAITPLIFHIYSGLTPPFTGVARKVILFPGQNGLVDAVIETPAGRLGSSTIVIAFDVAGFPIGQAIFDIITQEITSPLFGE